MEGVTLRPLKLLDCELIAGTSCLYESVHTLLLLAVRAATPARHAGRHLVALGVHVAQVPDDARVGVLGRSAVGAG